MILNDLNSSNDFINIFFYKIRKKISKMILVSGEYANSCILYIITVFYDLFFVTLVIVSVRIIRFNIIFV